MSSSKKIVFIVGSLRRNSHNRTLAGYAAEVIGDRADVEYLEYADVPLMNEDIEFPPPPEVVRVREQVEAADAVWIFTPEYNFSYPAGLKNVLDWLSRPQVAGDFEAAVSLTDMPVAISGAGGKAPMQTFAVSSSISSNMWRRLSWAGRARALCCPHLLGRPASM